MLKKRCAVSSKTINMSA